MDGYGSLGSGQEGHGTGGAKTRAIPALLLCLFHFRKKLKPFQDSSSTCKFLKLKEMQMSSSYSIINCSSLYLLKISMNLGRFVTDKSEFCY